jgi:hypothetical protein
MFKLLKRYWLRFKQSWYAFKREWRYTSFDKLPTKGQDNSFQIVGLSDLRKINWAEEPDMAMRKPYFGEPLLRLDGHVHTLKYHYIDENGNSRYFDTKQTSPNLTEITSD